MKRSMSGHAYICATAAIIMLGLSASARALDLESFDFNDADGTTLTGAANTANPGNGWLEDGGSIPSGMAPSDIRGGVYNIVKGSSVLESNYFQIANISSGTYYLTTQIANWQIETFDPANLEEFRVAFLNDDDANFGSTITAQVTIRRESGGGMLIAGDALGAGASVIPNTAPLSLVQSQPFTTVIELNKTTNIYKVFYKDGSNPTQVLGMANVSPSRGGNSVRMAANNDFSTFNINYPNDPPYEVVGVDRIALSDTNPLTDLITLEIQRSNGEMMLRNTSGAALTGLESYSITSTLGAFDPLKWKTIAGNYDSAGNGAVDDAPWSVTASTKTLLAEGFTSGDGGGLTNDQDVDLSILSGDTYTWLKSPFEDVHMTLNFAGGVTRTVNVNFVGNGGFKWAEGDLDFNNTIDGNDWLTFIGFAETDLSGLTRVERYQRGDLNGDGFNNINDFVQFKALYDTANGGGSFDAMLARLSIPEPNSVILLSTGLALAVFGRRRRLVATYQTLMQAPVDREASIPSIGVSKMPRFARLFGLFYIGIAFAAGSPTAHAVILEDFPFNDADGSQLIEAENVANSGNFWLSPTTGTGELTNSSVLNGSFRIQKDTTNLSQNYIDIANVTSGKAWIVAEIAGWNFTSTASSPSEEVRFAFLDNDNNPPSGSTITASMDIGRSGSGLALFGRGVGGVNATQITPTYALQLVQSTPFTMVLELDKSLNQYSVYYKDNTPDFALLGTGNIGLKTGSTTDYRDGNSIRLGITGNYSAAGEFFDIDRLYVTNTSPLGTTPPEPVALTLQAFSDGHVSIFNDTANPISLNSYRIASSTSALNYAGWVSLSDQNLDPVAGGDDPGETWDEAGGSNDKVLAEYFLQGSSIIAPSQSLSLGSAFHVNGDHNLTFQYYDVGTSSLMVGTVDYPIVAGVNGDYNKDDVVDAADYVIWRHNENTMNMLPNDPDGGTIDGRQYTTWKANFGSTSPGSGGSGSTTAVPEPATAWLIGCAALAIAGRRRLPGRL